MDKADYVLVVEDDKTLCDLMHTILDVHGYRSKAVRTSAAALNAIREERPKIILLDYLLDEGTCEDTLLKDPSLKGIPIILVTGVVRAKELAERLSFPLVTKPYKIEYLTDLVNSTLSPT